MQEIGIDISGHTSNNLNEYLDMEFDYVITVCDNAAEHCPVFFGPKGHPERSRGAAPPDNPSGKNTQRVHWPFFDPASVLESSPDDKAATDEEVMQVFRKVRDEIGEKVKGWVGSIQ
jgi:arsenate reductase